MFSAQRFVEDYLDKVEPDRVKLKIGERYLKDGKEVQITSGWLWSRGRLIDFWTWRPVASDGSLGAEEYGCGIGFSNL